MYLLKNDGLFESPSNCEFNQSMVIIEIHHRFQAKRKFIPNSVFFKIGYDYFTSCFSKSNPKTAAKNYPQEFGIFADLGRQNCNSIDYN